MRMLPSYPSNVGPPVWVFLHPLVWSWGIPPYAYLEGGEVPGFIGYNRHCPTLQAKSVKRLVTSLIEAERGALHEQLEQWLAAAEAQRARVLLSPEPEKCRCQPGAEIRAGAVAARSVKGPCPIQPTCQVLDSAGTGESSHLLCLRYRARSGSTLFLQLGVAESPAAPTDPLRRISLGAPLLMWTASTLENHALRDSLLRAITAHDEEREWIALEVHDRIAQTLASVFHQFQAVEGLTQSYPEIHQIVVRGSVLCRDAIKEARNIMDDLRPPILDELGLVPAVEGDLRRLADRPGWRVNQELSLRARLPHGAELTLYRIFREALLNVQRHVQPTEVGVALHKEGEGVRLEVSDNGAGFDVQKATEEKRVGGLLSMRRRAEVAGGTWDIQSTSGRGTTVSVWLPSSSPMEKPSTARRGSRP